MSPLRHRALLALPTSIALAACGGSSSPSGTGGAGTGGTSTTSTSSSTSTTSTSSSTTSTTATTSSGGTPSFNWDPGYYLLVHDNLDKALQYPKLAPFAGVHARYFWSDCELAPGDYSTGIAKIDADLAAVKAKGKKLLVFLNYEKSDGTPAVPADLLTGPGPWCSGAYCGQLPNGNAPFPIYWNDAVVARMRGWLAAVAGHLQASPDRDLIAGITLPETAVGNYSIAELQATGYSPDKYLTSVEGTIQTLLTAAPSLITFQYINGGFKPNPGGYFLMLADWAVAHPGAGLGIPDLVPNAGGMPVLDPVLRSATYEDRLPRNPDVQAPDYGLDRTSSLAATLALALSPAPAGMKAGYVSVAFVAGPGPNAFTLDELADAIPANPTNPTPPTW